MEQKNKMPKKLLKFVLNFFYLQKFTRIKFFLFLAKSLLKLVFKHNIKSKNLSAENTFIFFRQFANMNKKVAKEDKK